MGSEKLVHSTRRIDWMTPLEIIDLIGQVRDIDLDPCAAIDPAEWFAPWNANGFFSVLPWNSDQENNARREGSKMLSGANVKCFSCGGPTAPSIGEEAILEFACMAKKKDQKKDCKESTACPQELFDQLKGMGLGNESDGLVISWERATQGGGLVYFNPPYGSKGQISLWLEKANEEHNAGCEIISLIPGSTGARWFQESVFGRNMETGKPHATEGAQAVCFVAGRRKFREPGGGETNSATFWSVIPYWGGDRAKFFDVFESTGELLRCQGPRWKRGDRMDDGGSKGKMAGLPIDANGSKDDNRSDSVSGRNGSGSSHRVTPRVGQ